MSIADEVAAHLPYLRRFARALTGSQKSGDAYVASTLEAILADPSIISDSASPRIGLYSAFLKIVSSIPLNGKKMSEGAYPSLEAAHRNLELLTPRARQAFLLI